MKKYASFALAVVLLLAVAAFAADARSATDAAKALVDPNAVYLYTEKDGKYYEVHFINETTFEEFEISVPTNDGLPTKLESEVKVKTGAYSNTLSDEDAIRIVQTEYPEAAVDAIHPVFDDGAYKTHVYFSSPSFYGMVKLHSESGEILKRKIHFAAPSDGWQMLLDDDYYKYAPDLAGTDEAAPENSSSSPEIISASEAMAAVKAAHPGAVIGEIELDFKRGSYVYEGEAYLNKREYEFKVDAHTGKLIEWKRD